MKQQDYRTHRQFVPAYHFLLFGLIIIAFFGSIFNLLHQGDSEPLVAILLVLISVILIFLFFFARIFALKAQNRAIRAEETLRHLILTGKSLDSRLTIQQIIAIRFAPDEELPELVRIAAEKNLSPDAIKRAIKQWKADNHRV